MIMVKCQPSEKQPGNICGITPWTKHFPLPLKAGVTLMVSNGLNVPGCILNITTQQNIYQEDFDTVYCNMKEKECTQPNQLTTLLGPCNISCRDKVHLDWAYGENNTTWKQGSGFTHLDISIHTVARTKAQELSGQPMILLCYNFRWMLKFCFLRRIINWAEC